MQSPIFVLGPGRSFTSVFGVMLGQHPQLFGLPELNLTSADTVGEWFGRFGVIGAMHRAGVLRALAYFSSGEQTFETVREAEAWLRSNPQMTTKELFDAFRQEVAPRAVVEKSPLTVMEDSDIGRLDWFAPDARYIHITRHPYSACDSIMKTDWYVRPLKSGFTPCFDERFDPPVFDPQVHWHDAHDRIGRYLETIPRERWIRLRGEDVLSHPSEQMRRVAHWLGLDTNPPAIRAMLHPENTPFAGFGPRNALLGNDPSFLHSPELRPFTPPKAPLSGEVTWRGDRVGLMPHVVKMARDFGYKDESPTGPPKAAGFDGSLGALVAIRPDGKGMPMAHANRFDNSCTQLAPLRRMTQITHFPEPAFGAANFGAYTGRDYIITIFDSVVEPALVALDPVDGSRLWETQLGILPAVDPANGRWLGGLFLAELEFETGDPQRCIFAGNQCEICCLGADGKPIWRRKTADIAGTDTRMHGTPRCLRMTDDNALIYASKGGYIVKLDPLTGDVLDTLDLADRLRHDASTVDGYWAVHQSVVIHGDQMYFEGMFQPLEEGPDSLEYPVRLFRVQISGLPDKTLGPWDGTSEGAAETSASAQIGLVGDRRQGGSPCGRLREDGSMVMFTNGYTDVAPLSSPEQEVFQLRAVQDDGDGLKPLWTYRIDHVEAPKITAAPAIDPVSDTYIATSRPEMYLFSRASERQGDTTPDLILPALDALAPDIRSQAHAAEFSSAITLARDPGEEAFVAYVGLSVWVNWTERSYCFLTALEITPGPEPTVQPLWSGSVVVDGGGIAQPAARSFAQPALFEWAEDGEVRTGLAMGTMLSGVGLFR